MRISTLFVNSDGIITTTNPVALKKLGYPSSNQLPSSFFNLVHRQFHYRVIRDIAEMVHHNRSKSEWLLRLKTGNGNWKWFKVTATNELSTRQGISVHLKEVLS